MAYGLRDEPTNPRQRREHPLSPHWASAHCKRCGQWSQQAVSRAKDEGRLAINSIMYAQVSTGFDTIEDLDAAVPASDFEREPLPYEAGFVASRV